MNPRSQIRQNYASNFSVVHDFSSRTLDSAHVVSAKSRFSPHLFVKVCFGEFQRVQECIGSCELHIVAGLFLSHSLDDGSQDLIGFVLKLLWILEEVVIKLFPG